MSAKRIPKSDALYLLPKYEANLYSFILKVGHTSDSY